MLQRTVRYWLSNLVLDMHRYCTTGGVTRNVIECPEENLEDRRRTSEQCFAKLVQRARACISLISRVCVLENDA